MLRKLCFPAFICMLAACGGHQKNIYDWGGGEYTNATYSYLIQEGDPQDQLQQLQALAQKNGGSKVPPGLYAQIGLLYTNLGDNGKALEAYNQEAKLFPESNQYIQFLINKNKNKGVK